jgi:hypothetical protein
VVDVGKALAEAFQALADAVRSTYGPVFEFLASLGAPSAPKQKPVKKKPLIHNGRKPRK